jgi:hypothetical protein
MNQRRFLHWITVGGRRAVPRIVTRSRGGDLPLSHVRVGSNATGSSQTAGPTMSAMHPKAADTSLRI